MELNLVLAPRSTARQAHPVGPGDAAAVQPRDFRHPAVPPDLTPILIRRPWTLGARGRTTRVNLSELSMQYGHVRAISRSVGGDHRPLERDPAVRRRRRSRAHRDWLAAHQPRERVGHLLPSHEARERRRALRDRRQHDRHASHTGPQQSLRTDHVPLPPLRDADGNAGLRPGGPVRQAARRRAAGDHRFHSASTKPLRDAYEGRSRFRSSDLPREPRRESSGPRDQQLSSADTLVAQTSRPRQRTAPLSLRDRSRRATVDVPAPELDEYQACWPSRGSL